MAPQPHAGQLTQSRDMRTRAGERRNAHDELRQRRRADLFFEDSIVLLSILLGGAIGYMTATTVHRTTWSSAPTRKPSERGWQQPLLRPTETVTHLGFAGQR